MANTWDGRDEVMTRAKVAERTLVIPAVTLREAQINVSAPLSKRMMSLKNVENVSFR